MEPLEVRTLLAIDTYLDNSTLWIVDYVGEPNALTLSIDTDSGDIKVHDTAGVYAYEPPATIVDDYTVLYAFDDVTQIIVSTGLLDDTLTVDFTDGSPIPSGGLDFDGGSGANELVLQGGTETTNVYSPGPNPGSGTIQITAGGSPGEFTGLIAYNTNGGALTSTIRFENLSPVVDLMPGPATVTGTPADNAINYTQGSVAANGLVTIDNFESYEFSNKTSLTIDGLAGSDTINLNNPNQPTDLAGIIVNGGDPTASDTVIVNGTTGQDNIDYSPTAPDAATITGAGPVDITVSTTEHVIINGQGGNDNLTVTTPTGWDIITYTPGSAQDAASVQVESVLFGTGQTLLPMQFLNLGTGGLGAVTLADAGGDRMDTLVYRGTPADDQFFVDCAAGYIQLNQDLPVNAPGAIVVTLEGLEGDDAFYVFGNPVDLPVFSVVQLSGGGPSGVDSDTALFVGGGSVLGVYLGSSDGRASILGGGLSASTDGVEVVDLDASFQDVYVYATTSDDTVVVTPLGADNGTLRANNVSPAFNFFEVQTFTVDLDDGSDTLVVNGSADSETIDVSGSAVTVGSRITVNYTNAEALTVNGNQGDDTFNVTPDVIPIFIDGGDPIGVLPGDAINIVSGGSSVAFVPGPHTDEGALLLPGNAPVSYVHIEKIGPFSGPSSVLIQGTNGDDDITVIARDDSYSPDADGQQDFTVSVNNGPDILFIDTPELYLDGLAGDDDFDIRAPAPNGADWDVDVYVAGGPPAASDKLVFETPLVSDSDGSHTVVYTPTGADTGTILLDQGGPDSLITMGPFTVSVGDFTYNSSPGGIEQLIYDGQSDEDSLTIDAAYGDTIVHTPGSADNAGTFQVSMVASPALTLLPISYQNLGPGSSLTVDDEGGTTLVANGTATSDTFTVDTATGTVHLNTRLPIAVVNVQGLVLNGLDGDDTFNLNAPIYYSAGVTVDGGNPSASDVLNLTGAAATAETVTIKPNSTDPTRQDITGLGAQITATGVELIHYAGTPDQIGSPDDELIVDLGAGNNTARVAAATPQGRDIVTSNTLPAIEFEKLNTFELYLVGVGSQGANVATFVTSHLSGALPAHYELEAGAADTLVIEGEDGAGPNANDSYTVTKPTVGSVAIKDNNPNGTGVTVTETTGNLGRLQLNTLGGDDLVTVDVNGPASDVVGVPITFDGGAGKDGLTVSGTPTTAVDQVSYTPGPDVSQGRLLYTNSTGGTLMTIDVVNLEPVVDLVLAANLVVNGTAADNAINYTQGSVAANGLVTIDNFESYEFSNKTSLTINGLAGSDTINLNNPSTPTELKSITVNGGDPTASDTVIVNGTTGQDTINYSPTAPDAATITGAGPVSITVNTTEHVIINGQGGQDNLTVTTPAGSDVITYTPGSTWDAASVQIVNLPTVQTLLPMQFLNLGVLGQVALADAGGTRQDYLEYQGTAADDTFSVDAAAGTIQLNYDVQVSTPGVSFVRLYGLQGDDRFDIFNYSAQPAVFSGISLSGGDPSGVDSDVAVLSGDGLSAITASLGNSSGTAFVSGGGLATGGVNMDGVEVLEVHAANQDLTATTTASDDTVVVTPLGADSGTLRANNVSPVLNFFEVSSGGGTFTVDLGDGSDTLVVNGSADSETIDVSGSAVTVGSRITVNYANAEALTVNGNQGTDTFNVTPDVIPIFIDGGDPIGVLPGDTLSIVAGGDPLAFFPGPHTDEGGFQVGTRAPVSFAHIESIGPVLGPSGVLISGTNGDDDITVIARDDSYSDSFADGYQDFTVSVNAGPDILFIDTPELYLDGLAGDDDFDIRAPAPNDAPWNVYVYVAGGPPAASDKLVFETPLVFDSDGSHTVVYTPTGADTGTILLDQGGPDSLITMGPFTINVSEDITYNSSPGGIEVLIYDGQSDQDSLTIDAAYGDTIVHTPGSADNAGTFQVSMVAYPALTLLPISYQNLGEGSLLTVDDQGGTTLVANGTATSDTFTVDASGTVHLNTRLPIAVVNVQGLVLNGLDGDDTFNLNAPIYYSAGVTVDGGDPSASDVLNLFGTPGAESIGVNLASSTVTGLGGPVTYVAMEVVNITGGGGADTLTVNGTPLDDTINYQPTSDSGGTFILDEAEPVFNFDIGSDPANTFTVNGNGGVADQVVISGTNSRDLFSLRADLRTATLTTAGTVRKPVVLGADVQILTALGLRGQDTFQVTPAAGTEFTPNNLDNLLVNVDGGGPDANDALVIQSATGGALDLNQFVVVNRGRDLNSGTVRVYTAAVQWPDINYTSVEVVSPNVAVVSGNPNLLILGPDNNEPNEYQANATFLGSGATLQVQHASIFPNNAEFPGVPADNDFYRVVAQQTGTLDFQVYFRVFNAALLPAGGNLNLQVFDVNGNVVAAAPGTFGAVGTTANARVRIPVVAGQSYFLRVFGATGTVINGYDATIINTPSPVPWGLQLSRSVSPPIAGNPDTGDLPPSAPNSDSGRSQFDDVTKVNTPTVFLLLDDAFFLQDLPGNQTPNTPPAGVIAIPFNTSTALNSTTPGFRVAIYDGGAGHAIDPADPTFLGFAQQVPGFPHLYSFTVGSQGADTLVDGLHHLTAKVQIIDPATPHERGFSERSLHTLDIVVDTAPPPVFFGSPSITDDGLDPASDSGVQSYPPTFTDRVTSDTTPSFFGTAEANSIVRAYVDVDGNLATTADDVFIGETVAVPLDGTNAFPDGQWNLTSIVDMNNPAFFGHDGTRKIIVTAEDLAGNLSQPQVLRIFVDTQGPQVDNVQITGHEAFSLFSLKPDNASQGPTPLVYGLTITVKDEPGRDTTYFPNYVALLVAVAATPGNYVLKGDHNGIIPIQQIIVTNNPLVNTQPATATIQLVFAEPLPDDRYTLTISDNLSDPAGNKLDGESNAQEPQGTPHLPSGDGHPGGNFIARFTVDSRPEIGVWDAGSVYVDTNGNFEFDPRDTDYTDRDISYALGFTSDHIFAGNFVASPSGTADGFDKLAGYGKDGTKYRWLIDTDNDGVPNLIVTDPAKIIGIPVAGEFDGNTLNGDEVGLFDGKNWYLDTNHDFKVDTKITSAITGMPIVGDFDGDGLTDLATWQGNDVNKFFFDLASNGFGQVDATIDAVNQFGFIGARLRPVAADMDQDGITDVGLWVPDRSGASPEHVGEWYFLLSNDLAKSQRKTGQVNTLNHQFSPLPLGGDVFARFGNEYAVPVIGNFDPPLNNAGHIPPAPIVDDGPVYASATPGLYNPAASSFYLKDSNSGGFANITFGYGPAKAGWIAVNGDWDGDGKVTVGLYDPAASRFYLRNSNSGGFADLTFNYGPAGAGWKPLVGDWDHNGTDTIGLYNPASGTFYLKNSNGGGVADNTFSYGPAGAGWAPITGDWDGDGTVTIGLFNPAASTFYLKNSNSGGFADLTFNYGPAGAGWKPLVGDWDANGTDTIGLYNPANSAFYERNSNSGGVADHTFSYGPAGAGWAPLAGQWMGLGGSPVQAADGAAAAAPDVEALSAGQLQPIANEAIARWARLGSGGGLAEVLQKVTLVITDLPGSCLSLQQQGVIYVDRDAAGHGWFVDATPGSDTEFAAPQSPGQQQLAVDPRAVDRIDLLTVVSHELGHAAGLDDLDLAAQSLMSGKLPAGMRRLPGAAEADAIFATGKFRIT